MREIKFRAWHPGGKEMVYFKPEVLVRDIHQNEALAQLMLEKSKFLMQFTGLKDKNGVDIYEGDFLESNVWACWECKDLGDIENFGLLANTPLKNYSIIGNIYENPEFA